MGIKIRVSILLLVSFFLCQPVQGVTFPNRPPLPEVDQSEIQNIMVIVKDAEFERIHELLINNRHIVIHQTYQHVFHGFSIEGPVKQLSEIIENESVIHSSPIVSYASQINESVPFIGGEEVRGLFDAGDHRLTGKGVKVAVIDTGIDYEHPDLHRNYAGGYDVIDGDEDPMETLDARGQGTIHGTHVAGIIAANGKLRGMAPEADIFVYRALGPGGMGTSDQVIAAIDRAMKDKVDIINLSLGNNVNGPDWPTSLALDRAVDSGIVAVTSSGNSGPDLWTVGSPGTSSKAITVGASSPPINLPYLSVAGLKKAIPIHPLQGAKPWDLKSLDEIEYVGLGREEEISESIKGKIALIERGKIPFTEKVLNAKKHGAKAVLIFNNVKGNFAGSLEVPLDITAASISKKDGLAIKKRMEQNPSIRTIYKQEEDKLADFSSRGPVTTTWAIKPDIVAPGVAIDSTVPDGYLSLHGTSMAAPHVAGACALIKQAHPNWTPAQIKASLMNTATTLLDNKGNKLAPNQQGAGRINVKQAIEAEVLIYPGALTFGQFDTDHPRKKKTKTIMIDNQSKVGKTVTFQTPKNKPGIRWVLPKMIKLKPGEKKQVEVSIDITPNIMKRGIYEGWLTIHQDNNKLEIPYAYVIDEPNYPRIMGFEFTYGDKPNVFAYQMYLPGGADEAGIALYDRDSLRFVGFLDWLQEVPRGLVGGEIKAAEIKVPLGDYKAIIFAKKDGQENYLESDILLSE